MEIGPTHSSHYSYTSFLTRFGRLMVRDSNELEWLYIIKSGEARVIKQLVMERVNMAERHQHIQGRMDDQDPFHQAQTIINFTSTEKSGERCIIINVPNLEILTVLRTKNSRLL